MKKFKTTVSLTIEITADVEVEGMAIPAMAGRWNMPNGDWGYPDEPAEFEIQKVLWNGVDITDALDKQEGFDWSVIEQQAVDKIFDNDECDD